MFRYFCHFLLPLLLFDATVNAGIKLPIFATSDKNIRPAEIGTVKAQATCESVVDQDFTCGKDVTWKKWGAVDTDTGKITMEDVKIDVGCNHDSTISGNVGEAKGTSCSAIVSCSSEKCSDLSTDNSKNIYAFLDPQCFVETKNGDKLQSRWGNYEKKIRDLADVNPANANVTTGDIYVAMPTYDGTHGRGGIPMTTKKFIGHRWWTGLMAEDKIQERFSCKDGCKYGTHILVRYQKREKGMHLFLQPTCSWFTVCTNWRSDGTCPYQSTINVMLKNGFVSFDSRREQLPTKLIRKTKDGKGLVRVDLSLFEGKKVGDEYSKAAITTMFRHRVVGTVNLGSNMMITFAQPDCLDPRFGLRAQTSDVEVVLLKTDKDDYKAKVKADNEKNIGSADCQVAEIVADVVLTPPTDPPINPEDTTEPDVAAPPTTTPALPPSANIIALPKVADPNATKATWSGHATWAIFYGWLIGSFGAFFVMAPIMYFCRRSLYNDWYRGMFRRYGCDASGTTGGVTGAAFSDTTTSGNTMMTMQSQMDTSTMTQQEMTAGSSRTSSHGSSIRTNKSETQHETPTLVTM